MVLANVVLALLFFRAKEACQNTHTHTFARAKPPRVKPQSRPRRERGREERKRQVRRKAQAQDRQKRQKGRKRAAARLAHNRQSRQRHRRRSQTSREKGESRKMTLQELVSARRPDVDRASHSTGKGAPHWAIAEPWVAPVPPSIAKGMLAQCTVRLQHQHPLHQRYKLAPSSGCSRLGGGLRLDQGTIWIGRNPHRHETVQPCADCGAGAQTTICDDG